MVKKVNDHKLVSGKGGDSLKSVTTFGCIWIVAMLFTAVPVWSYQETNVSNGGTITGTIIYKGSIPTRKIVPTKDTAHCGGVRDDPLIITGPGDGAKFTVVYLKDIKKGKAWDKTAKTPQINNLKCRFVPHVQAVPVGSKLEILNSDPVLHNTHGFLGKKTIFNIALPFKDAKVKRPLRRTGIVRVECDSHGWMRGWIYVADNPYYAVTNDKGKFIIKNIPPGQYNVVIWQEHTGTIEKTVTVKAKETVSMDMEIK